MIPACGRRVLCRDAGLSVDLQLFWGTAMATGSNFGAAKILCVESDVAVLESRCAVLKFSGYDAASATPRVAEIVLRSQKFDLVVVSRLGDSDLHRVI